MRVPIGAFLVGAATVLGAMGTWWQILASDGNKRSGAGDIGALKPFPTACDRLAGTNRDAAYPAGFPNVAFTNIDSDSAIKACKDALASNQDEPRFQFELGRAYHKAGLRDEAIMWYRKAANKEYSAAQANLGLLLIRSGGEAEGREWLLRAQKGGDRDASAFLEQAGRR